MEKNWANSVGTIPELERLGGYLPKRLAASADAVQHRLYGEANQAVREQGTRETSRKKRKMESCFTEPQTVITGDFKAENLFFSLPKEGRGTPVCAAVDFQWAGGGSCAIDVVYLLWTSLEENLLSKEEGSLLDAYWQGLGSHGVDIKAFTRKDLQRQYELAIVDFARFALADGCLIESDVSLMERASTLLARVDQGGCVGEEEYKAALASHHREFWAEAC